MQSVSLSCMTFLYDLVFKSNSLLFLYYGGLDLQYIQCVTICFGNVRVIHVLNFDAIFEPVEMKEASSCVNIYI